MRKLFFLLAFLLPVTRIGAQAAIDFHHYEGITCIGLIPKDFTRPTQEKYNEDLAKEVKATDDKNMVIAKDNFALESNYLIDGLLQSGKVLFGDTVTQYLNHVADHVLVNEPNLRAKLRFYCLRSTEANAFSTNQGMIFVTLGLLAQLENEAQLAFILSHEIAHYELRHSINAYLQNDVIFNKKSRYDSYNDRIRVASTYSKEREIQADSLAMVRISKTIYSCREGIEALFVTQYSTLPFEDFEFNVSNLQPSMMHFPANLFLDSVKPIDIDRDNDDDSRSTHPNMATRRRELEKVLNGQKCPGASKFIESRSAFLTIRKIARFETIGLQLQEREYCVAYYNSFLLLQEDSADSYLKACMGKALYGLAKYKTHDNYDTEKYNRKEGNQQQCYYFFSRLTAPQLNLIALRYLYDLSQADSSYLIIAMRNDLAEEAVSLNNMHYTDQQAAVEAFKRSLLKKDSAKPVVEAPVPSVVDTNAASKPFVSKYDKLRTDRKKLEEAKTKAKEADHSNFHLLIFGDIIESPQVKTLFDQAEIACAKKIAFEKSLLEKKGREAWLTKPALEKLEANETAQMQKQGLCIDTVVFIDPYFMEFDDYNYPVFVESENTERTLPGLLLKSATPFKISSSVICPKTFTENDVALYNDLARMNDWTTERELHSDFDFLCLSTDKVIGLTSKYHTSHFCYITIYAYDHVTYYYTRMYDITTGYEEINSEDKKDVKARTKLIESLFNTTINTITETRNKRAY